MGGDIFPARVHCGLSIFLSSNYDATTAITERIYGDYFFFENPPGELNIRPACK